MGDIKDNYKSSEVVQSTKQKKAPLFAIVVSVLSAITLTMTGLFIWKCVSGGSGINLNSRFKHVEYTEITGSDKASKAWDILDKIYYAQTESKGDQDKRRLILPNQANLTTTFEIAINGSITHEELRMKDFNVVTKTNYQMSWNIEKQFVEFSGDDTSWYIVKDGEQYYCAFSYLVDGKEVKKRIKMKTVTSSDELYNYLCNMVAERGLILEDVDIGLSGLGYIPTEYVYYYQKMPSISSIFHPTKPTPETYTLYDFYDYLSEKVKSGDSLTYKVASNGEGTFSGNFVTHADVGALKKNVDEDIPEEYREFIEKIFGYQGISGHLDCDLFAAWDKNYICQQEYIVKADNLYIAGGQDTSFTEIKANAEFYFGEEASLKCNKTDSEIAQILVDYPISES